MSEMKVHHWTGLLGSSGCVWEGEGYFKADLEKCCPVCHQGPSGRLGKRSVTVLC